MYTIESSLQNLFALNEKEIIQLRSLFNHKQLKKGDFFIRKGQTEVAMSFVNTGLLRIYDTVHEKEVTQWISTPGYFMTDIAAFSFGVPARWNIQALSETEIYYISKTDYENLNKLIPDWPSIDRRFLSKCFAMMEDRIFGFLSLSAEERYQKLQDEQPELLREVPLQYLASMLGMTPETLSRIRKKI